MEDDGADDGGGAALPSGGGQTRRTGELEGRHASEEAPHRPS